ncbi:MAG: Hpt domain-containing protein [Leptospiraceae bacterium]|nr:Hpt domain-containing protein [Leptospiraceae bacterium]
MGIKEQIDPARLEELSALGDEFINEVLTAVKSSGMEMLSKYHAAVAANNTDEIKLHIHSLKGAILNVGLKDVSDPIQELNNQAKAGNFDAVQAGFPAFEERFKAILALID